MGGWGEDHLPLRSFPFVSVLLQPMTYIAGPERVHGQQVVAVSELELDYLLRGLENKAQLISPATVADNPTFSPRYMGLTSQSPTDMIPSGNDSAT